MLLTWPCSEDNRRPSLWPHTGAIFCGGKSRRMGRPKAGIILPNGLAMMESIYVLASETEGFQRVIK